MAKQALQGILSDLLGKYVDGLSLDNLRVGIFSGNIEIQNLTLKLNVLDQFNLPLRLIKGSIGTIKITIPWTNLGSKPVIFSLDGLYLQVDYTELKDRTAEELAELTHNLKQSILEKVQRLAFSNACSAMKVGSEDLKDETNKRHNFSSFLQNMGQRIASKILANLEATVQNIHIRFEDHSCSLQHPIGAGISIDEVSVLTTDSKWKETEAPSSHDTFSPFFKTVKIKNIMVYWDPNMTPMEYANSSSISSRPAEVVMPLRHKTSKSKLVEAPLKPPTPKQKVTGNMTWEARMRGGIFSNGNANTDPSIFNNCLVGGANTIAVHIAHNGSVDSTSVPREDISVEIKAIPFTVDQRQLVQIVDVLRRFAIYEKKKHLTLFRPARLPSYCPDREKAPKDRPYVRPWWVYAYQLVTGREDLVYRYQSRLEACLKNRDRYIELVMKAFAPDPPSVFTIMNPLEAYIITTRKQEPLTPAEASEMKFIEGLLPIQALMVFRGLAMEFIVRGEFLKKLRKSHEPGEPANVFQPVNAKCFGMFGRKGTFAMQAGDASVSVSGHVINSSTAVRNRILDFFNARNLQTNAATSALENFGNTLLGRGADDISPEELARSLNAEFDASERDAEVNLLLFRVNVSLATTITVTIRSKPVIVTTVACSVNTMTYSLSHLCLSFYVEDLVVEGRGQAHYRNFVIFAFSNQNRDSEESDRGKVKDGESAGDSVSHKSIISNALDAFKHNEEVLEEELGNLAHNIGDMFSSAIGVFSDSHKDDPSHASESHHHPKSLKALTSALGAFGHHKHREHDDEEHGDEKDDHSHPHHAPKFKVISSAINAFKHSYKPHDEEAPDHHDDQVDDEGAHHRPKLKVLSSAISAFKHLGHSHPDGHAAEGAESAPVVRRKPKLKVITASLKAFTHHSHHEHPADEVAATEDLEPVADADLQQRRASKVLSSALSKFKIKKRQQHQLAEGEHHDHEGEEDHHEADAAAHAEDDHAHDESQVELDSSTIVKHKRGSNATKMNASATPTSQSKSTRFASFKMDSSRDVATDESKKSRNKRGFAAIKIAAAKLTSSRQMRSHQDLANTKPPRAIIQYEFADNRSSIHIRVDPIQCHLNISYLAFVLSQFTPTLAYAVETARALWSSDFIAQAPKIRISQDGSGESSVKVIHYASETNSTVFMKFFHPLINGMHSNWIGDQLDVRMDMGEAVVAVNEDLQCPPCVFQFKKVEMSATINVALKSFDINAVVDSVAVSVPPTLAKHNKPEYLCMHPSTVIFGASNLNSTASDATITVSLKEPLHIELNTVSTLQIIDCLDKIFDAYTDVMQGFTFYPVLLAKAEANLFDHFSDKIPTQDPMRSLITFELHCPNLLVQYNYHVQYNNFKHNHSILTEVEGLKFILNERPCDDLFLVVISNFIVKDSCRPANSSWIIKAELEKKVDIYPLIHISIIRRKKNVMNNFAIADSDFNLVFTALEVNVDAHTILHWNRVFGPIMQFFLERLQDCQRNGVSVITRQHTPNKSSTDKAKDAKKDKFIEDHPPAEATAPSPLRRTGTFVSHITFKDSKFSLRLSIEKLALNVAHVATESERLHFEPVCNLIMHGFDHGITMADSVVRRCSLAVRTLQLLDARSCSQDFHFKTVLSMKPPEGITHGIVEDHAISIKYGPSAFNRAYVADIVFTGIQATACVDTIVDISSTGVGIAFAILTLISPTLGDARASASGGDLFGTKHLEVRLPGIHLTQNDDQFVKLAGSHAVDSSKAAAAVVTLKPSVRISASNVVLVLLADPRAKNSASILTTFDVSTDITHDMIPGQSNVASSSSQSSKGKDKPVDDATYYMSISANVSNVDLKSLSNTQAWLNHSDSELVVESLAATPFCVDFNLVQQSRWGIITSAKIAANLHQIDLNTSIDTLRIVTAIAGRSEFSSLKLSPEEEEGVVFCIWGADSSNVQKVVYDVNFKLDSFSLTSTSDSQVDAVMAPILRLTTRAFSFRFDGVIHPRIYLDSSVLIAELNVEDIAGAGAALVTLDFFHPVALQWEPVLEPAQVTMTVEERRGNHVFDVKVSSTLQVNLSGLVLETLLCQYAKLLWKSSYVSSDELKSIKTTTADGVKSRGKKQSMFERGLKALEQYRHNAWSHSLLKGWRKVKTTAISKVCLKNLFLSSLKYKVSSSSQRFNGSLASGDITFLQDESLSNAPVLKVQFQLPGCEWSVETDVVVGPEGRKVAPIVKNFSNLFSLTIETHTIALDAMDRISESVAAGGEPGFAFEIIVFCSFAFVDFTDLGLSIGEGASLRKTASLGTDGFDHKMMELQSSCGLGYGGSASLISGIKFNSQRSYSVNKALTVGSRVYTDRSLDWKHVPELFRNQRYISTPCNDFGVPENTTLISFKTNRPLFLFLLIESTSFNVDQDYQTQWLTNCSFVKAPSRLVAKRESGKGVTEEVHFIPVGRFHAQNEDVHVKSASIFGSKGFNLAVVVVDPSTVKLAVPRHIDILHSTLLGTSLAGQFADHSWVDGLNGVCAFHSPTNSVLIGASNLTCWSDPLNLSNFCNKQFLEISNAQSRVRYQLATTIAPLPGAFSRTVSLKIIPYFCVLNLMDEPIEVRPYDPSGHYHVSSFQPYECTSWHKAASIKDSTIQFKLQQSCWSFGAVDISEIGSSVVLLAGQDGGHLVLHVDVKLAAEDDSCAVCVYIWKEVSPVGATISIVNESDLVISVTQAELPDSSSVLSSLYSIPAISFHPSSANLNETKSKTEASKYSLELNPHTWVPYGWTDPRLAEAIIVTVPGSEEGKETGFRIEVLRLNEVSTIFDETGAIVVYVAVQARGNGKVVRIVSRLEEFGSGIMIAGENTAAVMSSSATGGAVAAGAVLGTLLMGPIGTVLGAGGTYALISKVNADAVEKMNSELAVLAEERARDLLNVEPEKVQRIRTKNFGDLSSNVNVTATFSVPAIAISIFAESPERREFLSIVADNPKLSIGTTVVSRSLEFSIDDIQVDTYSETASSPVVLKFARDDVETHGVPVLQFLAIEEYHPEEDTLHFKYVGLRLLACAVTVDSATLQLLAIDLGADFSFISPEQIVATHEPRTWSDSFSKASMLSEFRSLISEMDALKEVARAPKVFIENLVIHPVKISLSFSQTTLPRSKEQIPENLNSVGLLSYIPPFLALDNATLRLNSFIVCNVMESLPSLVSRLVAVNIRDLKYQFAQVAGSLAMIGGPIVLVKNIGGGVQSLFYEPYQGAVRSPRGFVLGLGKGTKGLVSGVVSGALNSGAGIVSTASQGISQGFVTLSGDEDFARARMEARKRAQDAAKGGMLSGLAEGGESVVNGLFSGLTGLVTTPISMAQSDGISGFVKGIGLGVVGVGMNPILGVSDGLNSVAQTVFVQLGDKVTSQARRKARRLQAVKVPVSSEADETGLVEQLVDVLMIDCVDDTSVSKMIEDINSFVESKKASRSSGGDDDDVDDLSTKSQAVGIVDIGNKSGDFVHISPAFIHWRRANVGSPSSPATLNSLSGIEFSRDVVIRWRNVTRCYASLSRVNVVHVSLRESESSRSPGVDIECADSYAADDLYVALFNHAVSVGRAAEWSVPNPHRPKREARRTSSPEIAPVNATLSSGKSDSVKSTLSIITPDVGDSSQTALVKPPNSVSKRHAEREAAREEEDRHVKAAILEMSAKDYPFGHANLRPLAQTMNFFPSTASFRDFSAERDNSLFLKVQKEMGLLNILSLNEYSKSGSLVRIKSDKRTWQKLDEIAWQLIKEWSDLFHDSRCCCCTIINETSSNIELTHAMRRTAIGVKVIEGNGYNSKTNQISPGGVVIVFAWGNVSSDHNDSSPVHATLATAAFSALMSSENIRVSPVAGGDTIVAPSESSRLSKSFRCLSRSSKVPTPSADGLSSQLPHGRRAGRSDSFRSESMESLDSANASLELDSWAKRRPSTASLSPCDVTILESNVSKKKWGKFVVLISEKLGGFGIGLEED